MEIKCQLDATEVFIADLIACSTCFGHHYAHHQELKSIIEWLMPVVFRAAVLKLLVWCGAEGYVSGLQDAAVSYFTRKEPSQFPTTHFANAHDCAVCLDKYLGCYHALIRCAAREEINLY